MAISLDPIRPYLGVIKAGLVAALLAAVFAKGCSVGQNMSDAKHSKAIAAKDLALNGAAASLRGAAKVLRDVDAETERLLKAEAEAKEREHDAAAVAKKALAELNTRKAKFADALEQARKNPDCDALMSADLRTTCGI